MPRRDDAGQLIENVAFDKREVVDDGYGNLVSGPWQEQFRQRAAFVYGRGAEVVEAAAETSIQSLIIRTRNSVQARTITTAWQARDVRTGVPYNIRTITTDSSRAMLELLCQSGGATG